MKKTIEYNGQLLTLYNYKEPLKIIPIGEGFGYYGALMSSEDGTKLQCHICGELVSCIASSHLTRKHHITAKEYKERFGLMAKTSLVSEKIREERKQRTLKWLASLTPEQKAKWKKGAKERYYKWATKRIENGYVQPKERLESKNLKGTCPDQLLQKIKDCAVAIKKSPSKDEFINFCKTQRFIHLIYKTFGSWSNAKRMVGYEELPKYNGGKDKNKIRYNDEELIEYLQMFYKETGKIPTETDFRRGLLPDSQIYTHRFGGMQKARERAGIYAVPSKWTNK